MLKQFGQPGDTKVTKDEVKAGVDKIFDQIDTNHDGEITPGELRAYRQERVKEWKAAHAKANDAPTPAAGPCTTATTGRGRVTIDRTARLAASRTVSPPAFLA